MVGWWTPQARSVTFAASAHFLFPGIAAQRVRNGEAAAKADLDE